MNNNQTPQDINTQLHNMTSGHIKKPEQKQLKPTELTPFHIVILLSIFAIIILLIITLAQIFRKNPYGEQIKINNLSQYYKDFPDNTKDSILNTLYNIVSINNPDTKIPKSGAKIREGSTTRSYNKNTGVYVDNFIIDIDSLQQSYVFQVTWSPNQDNLNLENVSYPVLATCPTQEQLTYTPFDCKDNSSSNGIYNDIVFSFLPINISYYENNYSIYVAYDIVAQVKYDKLTIVINDRTGGNHNAALNKLKEQGIKLEDYTIIYNDLSAEQTPSRAPSDATF